MTPEQITAGARTVAHLAEYFGELKQTVGRMIEQSQVGRRGHFTPSEEEAVRQLQASYWQSRAALFEVVLSFRDDTELPEPLRDDAFLVAYASAVLLVDAARFLRESFEPYPLARSKLNEPAPHFGIPGGMYDRVQKSLTSPRHVWHLYHAMQYYDEHKDQLQARATDPLLAPVCSVIERLEERIRVAASASTLQTGTVGDPEVGRLAGRRGFHAARASASVTRIGRRRFARTASAGRRAGHA